jgi:hypothetical protein
MISLSQDEIRFVCGPQVKGVPVVYPDHMYYFGDHYIDKLVGLLCGAKEQHFKNMVNAE